MLLVSSFSLYDDMRNTWRILGFFTKASSFKMWLKKVKKKPLKQTFKSNNVDADRVATDRWIIARWGRYEQEVWSY